MYQYDLSNLLLLNIFSCKLPTREETQPDKSISKMFPELWRPPLQLPFTFRGQPSLPVRPPPPGLKAEAGLLRLPLRLPGTNVIKLLTSVIYESTLSSLV